MKRKKAKYQLQLGLLFFQQAFQLLVLVHQRKQRSKAYNYVYTAEPETLDYVTSGKASTADLVTNGVGFGLLENDQYGNFVPSIAESWTVLKMV